MKYQPIFDWDAETSTAACVLTDGQHYFTGTARCHEDDNDMCSQKTGEEIAYRRARIEYLKFYRDTLKIQLDSLRQFYYSISHSKKFNSQSYEIKMLYRHIDRLKFDLNYAREIIVEERNSLKNYIDSKEKVYQKIRKIREQEKRFITTKDLENHIEILENVKEGKPINENI